MYSQTYFYQTDEYLSLRFNRQDRTELESRNLLQTILTLGRNDCVEPLKHIYTCIYNVYTYIYNIHIQTYTHIYKLIKRIKMRGEERGVDDD